MLRVSKSCSDCRRDIETGTNCGDMSTCLYAMVTHDQLSYIHILIKESHMLVPSIVPPRIQSVSCNSVCLKETLSLSLHRLLYFELRELARKQSIQNTIENHPLCAYMASTYHL